MFEKVLIANRGEIAIRIARALDEMGIASVAVYSELDRDAPHVQRAGEAYNLGDGPAAENYLKIEKIIDAAAALRRAGDPPRLRLPGRERARSRRPARTPAIVFIGPPASAIEAMGSKTRARELMKAAGVPIVPGTTEPVATVADALRDRQGRDRLPGRRQGGRRRRRQGLPRGADRGRARGRVRGLQPRRREVLLRPDRLPRALPARPAPRRGAGARRPPRQRDPPRRARLLDPAPPPEGDRGVAGARMGRRPADPRAHRQDRRGRGQGRRLRRRGHDRGPVRDARGPAGRAGVLLPRDEHARAGRALRDRDDDRHRHRQGGHPRGGGRGALLRAGGRRAARPRDRVPHQRRGRLQELRARRRARSAATASRPAPACASTRASRKTAKSRRCTTRWWPS